MSAPSPIVLPQELVAIALDTNSMPKGRLSLSQVNELSDLIEEQELEIEIWVPEPVLWEWAEHAQRDILPSQGPLRIAAGE